VTATTTDVFVTKLDPSGALFFTVTFSGKGLDHSSAIAVDLSGNILIAGNTSSTNFPLRNPLQGLPGVSETGFVMKLANDGSLLWSTYLGGTQGDSAMNGVAADAQGNVYVTGWTDARDYPRTSGLPADFVGHGIGSISGAFFAKISSAGNMIIYAGLVAANQHSCSGGSSCFLSPISTSGASVAVDSSGDAYIGGNTSGYGIQGTPGALPRPIRQAMFIWYVTLPIRNFPRRPVWFSQTSRFPVKESIRPWGNLAMPTSPSSTQPEVR
jgi:hypothetical protein